MPAAENVETLDVEERDQQVYSPREEEDLEEVFDIWKKVESEDLEQAVREISSIADDNLRNGQTEVNDYFRAPIQSLNNTKENSVELEYGTEAQVAGEEYSVGQTLPRYQHI